MKKDPDDDEYEIVQWPVFLPFDFVSHLIYSCFFLVDLELVYKTMGKSSHVCLSCTWVPGCHTGL